MPCRAHSSSTSLPARRDAHSLCGHDGEVVALGELHGLEQGHEPLFLDEQHSAIAIARAEGREVLLR